MTTKELGDLGEARAIEYLRKKGVKVITTNYRFQRNEVDIICEDDGKIVFVEVKTRATSELGPPWKAVTLTKQRQIIKCAHHYIVTNDIDKHARFDIVSIVLNSHGTFIEHIDDAFYPRV